MTDYIAKALSDASGFEWDTGNAPKVVARHLVQAGECEQAFFREPFVVSHAAAHSGVEPRWRALGQTAAGRALFLVFTIRGSLVRVLAARDMNRKERRYYAEITTQADAEQGTEEGPDV
ncbi:MAG: BrnT family toxin [Gemmatimonadaceae bacterium]